MRTLAISLLTLNLIGCDATESGDDMLLEQLPPPTQTEIWTGSVVTGEVVEVIIEGANPNDTLILAGSLTGRGSGPCPPVFGGTCLDIVDPIRLGPVVADSTGRVTHRLTIPARLGADDIFFQAIGGGWINSYTTQVVARTIQRSQPEPLTDGFTRPPVAPFDIEGMDIDGDTLFVDVSYSGGCSVHEFEGQWSGLFMESLPVQTSIQILKRPVFDPCDAIVYETLRYDLRDIRLSAGDGPLILNIEGEQLTYDFL